MLQIKTLYASLDVIKSEFTQSALPSLGISVDDFNTLRQSTMWNIQNRIAVQRALAGIRDGLAVAQGFQPFKVPAEYQAAIVVALVKPVNWRAACSWLVDQPVKNAREASRGIPVGEAEEVSAEQLFSLCLECEANSEELAADYTSKVSKETQRVKKPVKTDG